MGLINFTIVSAKFLNILSWPPLPLLYPLFFSIWAIESDTECSYEQCLKYWILFCITSICESMIALLLPWLPFWPYIRGAAFLLLAVPDFGGASYIYQNFIRPYTKLNSDADDTLLIPEGRCNMLIEEDEFVNDASQDFEDEREETWKRITSYEDNTSLSMLTNSRPVTWTINNMDFVESFTRANFQRLSSLISPSTKAYKWCVWTKPEIGWMKLNTDGSVDNKGNAGFGGLFRNFKGKPICAYVSKTDTNDIFLVELWAVWRGLVLALRLGLKLIWVESDSMSVVKTINKEQHCGPKAVSYLENIWKLLRQFDNYKVSHSWRETNKAADYLSKMDLLGCEVLQPVDFPNSLWKIIKDDARGKQYFRA